MADPDLQIREEGSPIIYTLREWGGGGAERLQKRIFSALRTSIWYKNKGREGGPFPWILLCRRKTEKGKFRALALRQSQSGDCELELCYWWEHHQHGNVENRNELKILR